MWCVWCAGTSLALRREPGWALGGWRAQLDTLQAAAGGLLRRGRVALAALGARNESAELLAVELWTRGLHALAPGAEPDPALYEADAEADAEVAGGLGFSVAGVAMPPVDLFTGQVPNLHSINMLQISFPSNMRLLIIMYTFCVYYWLSLTMFLVSSVTVVTVSIE